MIEPITIRTAALGDYEEVRALLAEADDLHRTNLPWLFQKPSVEVRPRAFFEQLLEKEDCVVLVAQTANRLVGVATTLLRSAPEFALFINQNWAVLDNIAVASGWRRRGVGTALIRDAERWAQARGASWVELGVYEFNDDARTFYRSLGYSPVSTKLRKPFGPGPGS